MGSWHCCLCFATAAIFWSGKLQGQSYRFVDLNPQGYTYSQANGISDGQAVGIGAVAQTSASSRFM